MSKNFDYEKELENLKCSSRIRAGLKYYFQVNKLEPKSKKDFDKIVKEFGELKLGE